MNVVSWINGDTEITDLPECSAGPLSRIVQRVNDHLGAIYGHFDFEAVPYGASLLTPEHAMMVVELALRTVGTAYTHPEFATEIWSYKVGVHLKTFVDDRFTVRQRDGLLWALSDLVTRSDGTVGPAVAVALTTLFHSQPEELVREATWCVDLWRDLNDMAAPAVNAAWVAEHLGFQP